MENDKWKMSDCRLKRNWHVTAPTQSPPPTAHFHSAHTLASLHPDIAPRDIADGKSPPPFPGRGKRQPLGQTRFPPLIVTGSIGTCASNANRTAPALNRSSEPVAVLRPPSGKITTAPPSRSHCNERRIAAGSLPSSASGHAPNHVRHLPTTGQRKPRSTRDNVWVV